jgi:hypothetical protein
VDTLHTKERATTLSEIDGEIVVTGMDLDSVIAAANCLLQNGFKLHAVGGEKRCVFHFISTDEGHKWTDQGLPKT